MAKIGNVTVRVDTVITDEQYREAMGAVRAANERMDLLEMQNAKLRGWWTHDGTWHVELPKLPDGIAVTMPDERDRDVRSARAWRYVREDNAENAKLRELVKHLRECTRHNTCAACEYADDACDFDYDMRELRVEVDG